MGFAQVIAMAFDRDAVYAQQLDWIVHLAKQRAWKAYAWEKAKEMDADQSGLFSGIAKDVKKRMQKWNAAQKQQIPDQETGE